MSCAAGARLAEVATAHGVDPQAVIDTLVTAATAEIDQAVTDGRIDADKADEIKATLEERVTDRVNGVRPERPAHDRGASHHRRLIHSLPNPVCVSPYR